MIGFIGTGEITKAVVTGLSTMDGEKPDIVVSPRNAEIAAELAGRFANVEIAASNQDVIDRCDTICLALRPQAATPVIEELSFPADRHVVSFMATYDRKRLKTLVAPATRVTLVTPLPAVAFQSGPTPIFPPDPDMVELFGRLGTAVAVETEDEYQALCVATSTLAGAFAYYGTIADFLQTKNVPADAARAFSGAVFYALAATAKTKPELSFSEITGEAATRGGTNEQVLRELGEDGVFTALTKALENIWQRFENAKK